MNNFPDPTSKHHIFRIIFAVIALLTMLFLGLFYFKIMNLDTIYPTIHDVIPVSQQNTLTDLPTGSPSQSLSCATKQTLYQNFLGPIHTVMGITVGTIRGTVKQVLYDNQTGIAVITLSSSDNHLSPDISVQDNKIRIANTITHGYEKSLAAIQEGQQVVISYDCNPKDGNNFVLTNISINRSITL